MRGARRRTVAVDLGSSALRLWVAGERPVVDPARPGTPWPVRHGVVVDAGACAERLRHHLRPALGRRRVCAFVSVPGLDETERERAGAAVRAAGAARVTAVEQQLAAAIGAGLDVAEPVNELVVDVGAGLVEVAAVGDGTVLAQRVLPWGLTEVARALRLRLRDDDGVVTDVDAAAHGLATGRLRGTDAATGDVRDLLLGRARLERVLGPVAREIRGAVLATLDDLPATRAADVASRGVVVVGGGSRVAGLPERLARALRMPARVPDDAAYAVLRGLARLSGAAAGAS